MKNQRKASFEALYQQLNPAQKEAVDSLEGPVVVIAGPGTGKTQVLSLRIANILDKAPAGIGPENILALTFTNAGATAMRQRLLELTSPEVAHRVHIFTFHSFAEEQMKEFPEFFAARAYFRPASEIERLQIVEDIVSKGDFVKLKTFGSSTHYTKSVLAAIDTLKKEGITEEDFEARVLEQEKEVVASEESYYKRSGKGYQKGDLKPDAFKYVEKNKELLEVYKKYQGKLSEKKLYDFNDMLLSCVRALEAEPSFRAELSEKYQYILVDEHQDTNGAQNRILELIIENNLDQEPNIFTVGDDKQAIYRFQGASIDNFLAFSEKFENTKIIHLTENYRSSQPILDAAHTLITNSESVKNPHVPLISASTISHENLSVHSFENYFDELWFLANDVEKKIAAGVDPNQIAVLYIENKFLEGIQEVFEKKGIAYSVSSKQSLFADPVMKKLLILLHAVAEPMNNEAFGEALLLDVLCLNELDVLTLFDQARYGRRQNSLIHLMKTSVQKGGVFHDDEALAKTADLFLSLHKKGNNMIFTEFFDEFLRITGFLQYLLTLPGQSRHLEQIATLLMEIRKNIEQKPNYRLTDFLAYTKTLLEYDVNLEVKAKRKEAKGVQLMTAHGSKGLEFEHVYITNFVHGKWSNKRKKNSFHLPVVTDLSDIDDERRLFYVALTRGKKDVTILYSQHSAEGKEQLPSLFVAELPQEGILFHANTVSSVEPEMLFGGRQTFLPKLTDVQFIRERFLNTKLSATALNNYYKSPLLYFFRNLVRLPSSQTETLLYGNVVHKTLELFFAEVSHKKSVPNQDRLLEIFRTTLDAEYLLHEYYEKFEKRGIKSLSVYYETIKDNVVFDLATEKKITGVTLPLPGGEELTLTGIIDKLEFLSDGTVRVIDYKTGKPWSEKGKEDRAHLIRQIRFYKLLLDSYEENGKRFVMTEGVLEFVEPNKKNKIERQVIPVTEEDVRILREEIHTFAKDVLDGTLLIKDFSLDTAAKEYLEFLEALGK